MKPSSFYWMIALWMIVSLALAPGLNINLHAGNSVQAATIQDAVEGASCIRSTLDLTADQRMPVPSFCIDGLCKIVVYMNAVMGAFAPGYAMEVYYQQWSADDMWVAGPNISLGGVAFSDGYGYNGNGASKGIFLGGTTADGGYVRIMDDGVAEDEADFWTIESQASPTLTQASVHVCEIPDVEYYPNITASTAIEMPSFCVDNLCMILRFTYATFGAFGPGLSLPVYCEQDFSTDEWIGGPNVSLGGVNFSAGAGENGAGSNSAVFTGGVSDGGGTAELLDDGLEWSDSQWSVEFTSGDDLEMVTYFIAPMSCTKHEITNNYTTLTTPSYCIDALCTIVRWVDGWFGAWGPGHSWPVHYRQDSQDDTWLGGPAVCLGGQCFSDVHGMNGDAFQAEVFNTGFTSPNSGYVTLSDDYPTAGETDSGYWTVDFNPKDDLTAASYYICSNTCELTTLLINKHYAPMTIQE